jgi:hypothetical protein
LIAFHETSLPDYGDDLHWISFKFSSNIRFQFSTSSVNTSIHPGFYYDFSGVEDQLPVEGLMSKLQPLQLLQRLVPGLLASATYGGYWDRNGRIKANS